MTARRSRLRSYLLLARVSNLPTVWTNVLASLIVSGGRLDFVALLSVAASLFYMGGMFLNDAFDASVDVIVRPERPIPAGDVSRREAFALGGLLLAGGEGLLLFVPHPAAALAWGAALSAAIVFYNYRHKGRPYGPAVMGLCRALVYCVSAAAAASVSILIVAAASALWGYIVLLSVVAKQAGPRAGVLVPWLLAGISLVDAAVIVLAGAPWLAGLAVASFFLTRALQRVVPGT